jgi:hypothetical protein
MLSLSPAADDRFVWNLLSEAPTPAQGANISRIDIERILKTHRIRNFGADEVLSTLKAAPLALAPEQARWRLNTSCSCFRKSHCSISSFEMSVGALDRFSLRW